MPNINNEDIEYNIINTSKTLFISRGYENVDMKSISKKCNLSIGTLYNYFPNKRKIIVKILDNHWQNTFSKLKGISSLDNRSKLKDIIEIIYDDMYTLHPLTKDIKKYIFIQSYYTNLSLPISHIVNSLEQDSNSIVNYLYSSTFILHLLNNIDSLLLSNFNDKEKNLDILFNKMHSMIYTF